jgi:MFS family permease
MNTNSMNASLQFGVDRDTYAHATALTYLCSIAISYPIGWLIDRLHALLVGLGVLLAYSLAMLAGWLMVHDVTTFQVFFVVHGVFAGAIFTTTTALLPCLLPRSRYAQLATVSAALTALMTVLLTPVTGALIDLIGGDFRLAFLMAGLTGLAGIVLWLVLLHQFARLGGRDGYVPPDVEAPKGKAVNSMAAIS